MLLFWPTPTHSNHAKISTHATHAKFLWTHATHTKISTHVTHAKILWTDATHEPTPSTRFSRLTASVPSEVVDKIRALYLMPEIIFVMDFSF